MSVLPVRVLSGVDTIQAGLIWDLVPMMSEKPPGTGRAGLSGLLIPLGQQIARYAGSPANDDQDRTPSAKRRSMVINHR